MRFSFRHGAMLVAAVAGVGFALATLTADRGARQASVNPTSDHAMDETTGSLGPGAARRPAQPLALTDEERARIHSRVIRMPNAPTVEVTPPELLGALPSFVGGRDRVASATLVQPVPRRRSEAVRTD